MLGALDGALDSVLARATFQTEDQLLGGLGLLTQDGLGLTTEALLLSVVTPLALSEDRLLRLLVLRHLELLVLVAVRTVSPAGLRDVHLKRGHKLEPSTALLRPGFEPMTARFSKPLCAR